MPHAMTLSPRPRPTSPQPPSKSSLSKALLLQDPEYGNNQADLIVATANRGLLSHSDAMHKLWSLYLSSHLSMDELLDYLTNLDIISTL